MSVAGVVQFLPTVERILFGEGCVAAHLQEEVARLGGRRPLLVTTPSLHRSSGPLAEALAALGPDLGAVFPGCREHVPLDSVIAAARAANEAGADLVITLGGGSVIDTGKALRACLAAGLTSERELADFLRSAPPLTAPLLPQIAIPTTLSGAEYTRSFSATDLVAQEKLSYVHSATAPKVLLYDPRMTLATPPRLWLSSGVMALTHAIEVMLATEPHPVGDMLKAESIRGLCRHLPRTRDAPEDLTARLHCQLSAWLADHSPLRATPLQPRPAFLLCHSLAYDLASLHRVPYGLSACVTLPAALRWYGARPGAMERQGSLAAALGIEGRSSPQEVAAAVEGFIAGLGLPTRLRDVGVPREALPELARRLRQRALGAGVEAAEVELLLSLENAW